MSDYLTAQRLGLVLGREYNGITYFDPYYYSLDPLYKKLIRDKHKGKEIDTIKGVIR